ncbi:hypothetical protein [Streptomyces sp. RB17]|uniref:hypothetical protein n=1 Tax=Streptomyces sp. RB17 TaxID=2585197 RepID=UPI0012977485|nr:hypothetical protein [Streptomyces sp. RB17]
MSADAGVVVEGAVDAVGESPSQCAYGFGAGVARFLASLKVGMGIGMVVGLSDRDAGAGEAMWPRAVAPIRFRPRGTVSRHVRWYG